MANETMANLETHLVWRSATSAAVAQGHHYHTLQKQSRSKKSEFSMAILSNKWRGQMERIEEEVEESAGEQGEEST